MGAALTPQDARVPGWALGGGVGGDSGGHHGSRGAAGLPCLPGAAGPVLSRRGPREGGEARAPARPCRWPGRRPAAGAER